MSGLDEFFQQKLVALAHKAATRSLKGNPPVSFCTNDYLGLSEDGRVVEAGIAALRTHGTGAKSSRLVAGEHVEFQTLEAALAAAKGTDAALVFGSGYLANIGVIPALVGRGDMVVADRLVHACMLDGARLSGADLFRFSHNSMEHLHEILHAERGNYQRCLILTETIFSMDGDMAPIDTIEQLASAHDAWILSDDAHGLYTHTRPPAANHLQLGTLSKALGGYGGYVAGSVLMKEYLINTARSLIFSTGLPPGVVASAAKALEIAKAEPWRAEKALSNARRFCALMELPEPASQIVPVILATNENALAAQRALMEAGCYVAAIRPPTVPVNTARLRLAFSASHSDEHLDLLAQVLRRVRAQFA